MSDIKNEDIDFITAPIFIKDKDGMKVVGHVILNRQMAMFHDHWSMQSIMSDIGLSYFATPKHTPEQSND